MSGRGAIALVQSFQQIGPEGGSPNISVNADVRELAFVQRRANQLRRAGRLHLATRGRRLPLR
jgi:hypothetical protein